MIVSDRMPNVDIGDVFDVDRVLLVGSGERTVVGHPLVKGAVVKSNSSEVDTKTKTLFRRNAALEPYKESSLNFGEF